MPPVKRLFNVYYSVLSSASVDVETDGNAKEMKTFFIKSDVI